MLLHLLFLFGLSPHFLLPFFILHLSCPHIGEVCVQSVHEFIEKSLFDVGNLG